MNISAGLKWGLNKMALTGLKAFNRRESGFGLSAVLYGPDHLLHFGVE